MVAQHRSEYSAVRKRMEIVFLGFLGVTLALSTRLFVLQALQSRGFREVAERTQGRKLEVEAQRGKIKDRGGALLATDILARSMAINPRVVLDKAATAARISELLGLEAKDRKAMQERMERADQRRSAYLQLHRGVERKLSLKVEKLVKTDPLLKGVWFEDMPLRVTPGGRDGIQLIGAVNIDGQGVEGLEKVFNDSLAGKNGERRVRVSASGQPIPESATRVVEPVEGKDVRLTIDRDIQHFVEDELGKVAQEETPDAATSIVMDIRNGDVLAMGNWPSYSPDQKKITPEERRNRAITDLFEPGSIFKVITASAALEYGVNTHVFCGGTRAIGNRTIHCAHGAAHGAVDLRTMIEKSCNIAAGTLAERIGPEHMYEFLDKMGFQRKTGIEFPGEEHGRLLPPDQWRTMRTINIGFGQGVVVTPIQILSAYAAIANDGIYNPPRLVMDSPGVNVPKRQPRRVMSAANARAIRSCMEAVVTSGTGKKAKIPGFSVAGKTGTAQIAVHGTYGHGYVASFVGFLPVSKPRLAILVSVWHPRKGEYGGVVSAPVFREIARHSVAYLGVPPDTPDDLRDGANPGSAPSRTMHFASAGGHVSDHD